MQKIITLEHIVRVLGNEAYIWFAGVLVAILLLTLLAGVVFTTKTKHQ